MAGSFKSARTQIVGHLRKEGMALVKRHAFAVLAESNANVPRLEESMGWATDALRSSGHVVLPGAGDSAYETAIAAAIEARAENRGETPQPDLVDLLGPNDFLPALQIPTIPATPRASVYYPAKHAMALELGWTLKSGMHPQAFFLHRAVENQREAFESDAKKLLASIEGFQALTSGERAALAKKLRESRARANEAAKRRREEERLEEMQNRVPRGFEIFEKLGVPGHMIFGIIEAIPELNQRPSPDLVARRQRFNQEADKRAMGNLGGRRVRFPQEKIPVNDREGWKRQQVWDDRLMKIVWEHEDIWLDRVENFVSRLGDNGEDAISGI